MVEKWSSTWCRWAEAGRKKLGFQIPVEIGSSRHEVTEVTPTCLIYSPWGCDATHLALLFARSYSLVAEFLAQFCPKSIIEP